MEGMMRLRVQPIVALTLVIACGGKSPRKPAVPTPITPASPAAQAPAPKDSQPVAASPNVTVSDELARKCSLKFANTDVAPKFGYNEAELLPADRDVLEQIARCLVKGPLDGKNVELVGRTDPRGTDEYNLGLGTRRAETVRGYLERLGVPAARISPTTRGELDATGSDDAGWQRDRRVDLQLTN